MVKDIDIASKKSFVFSGCSAAFEIRLRYWAVPDKQNEWEFTEDGAGGHSASEQAHFRHFQSVSETVFFVFSVNLIHILILFCPLWFRTRKYGRFMALFIFQ